MKVGVGEWPVLCAFVFEQQTAANATAAAERVALRAAAFQRV